MKLTDRWCDPHPDNVEKKGFRDIINTQSDSIGEYLGTPITMAMSKEQMFEVIKGLSATVKALQGDKDELYVMLKDGK